MSRYIDADKAEELLIQGYEISDVPTADVEEVRHGEWISELVKKCDWKGNKQSYYQPISCSLCHESQAIKYPYCPYCGAKMDGGKE